MHKFSHLKESHVTLETSFWSKRVDLVRNEVIPYQWRVLNDIEPDAPPSYTVRNLRMAYNGEQGQFQGMVFQDSDVAKWLEAAAYSLLTHPDDELERQADELIEVLARAQQSDGYLNSHFILLKPDKKWTNLRDWHELYCAGHLIEAAVAYYEATGKQRIIDVVCRLVDHISSVLGKETGKLRGYPGHEEIELALVKLYRLTNRHEYLELSRYFLEERGGAPHFFDEEAKLRKDQSPYRKAYSQSHLPIRDQTTAEGHSVRAMYLYCAMADLAKELDDESLLDACRTLWHNVTEKRMYVTGGIGSSAYEEAFTVDYDLPNDRAYTETCASIGLVFWAHRMLQIDLNSDYADVMERALFNGVLSGMSLDGKKYFYVNPLEVWPDAAQHRHDMSSVKTERQGWFGCACCPPNIARLLASFQRYLYSYDDSGICVHLYANSTATWTSKGSALVLEQNSNYPWDGRIHMTVTSDDPVFSSVRLRIPGWSKGTQLSVNGESLGIPERLHNGYVTVERTWHKGDRLELNIPMPVELIASHPNVRENAGRVAIQRGPVVFCLEEVDNHSNLPAIILDTKSDFQFHNDTDASASIPYITASAFRERSTDDSIYHRVSDAKLSRVPCEVKAVPYFSWCNREPGEMLVWVRGL